MTSSTNPSTPSQNQHPFALLSRPIFVTVGPSADRAASTPVRTEYRWPVEDRTAREAIFDEDAERWDGLS